MFILKKSALLFFLVTCICFSQGKVSEVTYKVKGVINIDENTKENVKNLLSDVFKEMETLEFVLLFNKTESIFYEKINMSSDQNKGSPLPTIGQTMSFTGKLYTNKNTGLMLRQKPLSSNLFIIESSISDIKWSLTNETKKISNYTCFKATAIDTIETVKGSKSIAVIAWYAPSLPFAYGPANYLTLPGLILELQNDKILFYADKIELDKISNDNLVIPPSKGKLVSKKEYNEIEKNGFEKYKQYIKN